MAKPAKTEPKDAKPVRYQVVAPVFVNDTYHDPTSVKGDLFIHAAPGLEGEALKLAPEAAAPAPKSEGEGDGTGQGSGPPGDKKPTG